MDTNQPQQPETKINNIGFGERTSLDKPHK